MGRWNFFPKTWQSCIIQVWNFNFFLACVGWGGQRGEDRGRRQRRQKESKEKWEGWKNFHTSHFSLFSFSHLPLSLASLTIPSNATQANFFLESVLDFLPNLILFCRLSAALMRQATYTTTRLGVYTSLYEKFKG
jgi:hypothetical protein